MHLSKISFPHANLSEYTAHQEIWKLFPNDGTKHRNFLFRQIEDSEFPQFWLMSEDEPQGFKGVEIVTKVFAPNITPGQKLTFSIKANPVVSIKTDKQKRGVRHDLWMHTKKTLKPGEDPKKACEEAAVQWLSRQGERCGFELSAAEVCGHDHHSFSKTNGKSKDTIRYISINFEGLLTVTDPLLFLDMLQNGIGKSRSFGCGLMMIRNA